MPTQSHNILLHACGPLKLHRIEAACQPHNQRSINVLENCGFKLEGHARQYLMINGEWQDHALYAFLSSDLTTGGLNP